MVPTLRSYKKMLIFLTAVVIVSGIIYFRKTVIISEIPRFPKPNNTQPPHILPMTSPRTPEKVVKDIWYERSRRNFILKPKIFIAVDEPKGLAEPNLQTRVETTPLNISQKTLILTYWTSKLSLLGKALNTAAFTFYHNEPLTTTSQQRMTNDNRIIEAVEIITQLLNCNYANLQPDKNVKNFIKPTASLKVVCVKQFTVLCTHMEFHAAICRLHPRQLIMQSGLGVGASKGLLAKFPDLRVIHLVQDPREIYALRKDQDSCNEQCRNPALLCNQMHLDFLEGTVLKEKFPERFLSLRLEDVTADLMKQSNPLYHFFKLPIDHDVHNFLKYEAKRTLFDWRKSLTNLEVQLVQQRCHDVMQVLNYNVSSDFINAHEFSLEKALSNLTFTKAKKDMPEWVKEIKRKAKKLGANIFV